MSAISTAIRDFRHDLRQEMEILKWIIQNLLEDLNPVRLFDHSGKVRKVMGKNFFGTEEWSKVLDRPIAVRRMPRRIAEQLLVVLRQRCPFEPNRLVKDTHVLFPGIARVKKEEVTLMWLQNHYPYFFDQVVWYTFQLFANAPLEKGWYLVYRSAVPLSTGLSYREQERMLPKGYLPTSVIEEIARRFLASRCWKSFVWPSSIVIRTRDFGLQEGRVCIDSREMPGRSGLDICIYAENERSSVVGISACRRVV